jgi:glycosyltransferase involved in cell wall biosynthesis
VITVHFVHGERSYLPELAAYQAHIEHLGHAVQMHTQAHTVPDDARAVWWICGRVPGDQARRLKGAVQVHEYASASVAPLAWLKDRVKQWQHPVPDFRVFQSEWVRQRMGFDGAVPEAVPYALRDMGVPDAFLTAQALQPPEFDLVYLGEMSRLLHFVPLLHTLGQAGLSLLLVGDVPPALQERLATLGHIQSTGRVPQDQVPAQLLRARAGLNLMPDVLPLSEQTSTKMLEYLALGLPVISNPYAWAHRTALAHAGRVQLLDVHATAAQWHAAVQGLPPHQTDRQHLQALRWSQQLQNLPVWSVLLGATA